MRGALALLLLLCSPCSTSTSHSEAISRGLSAPHNVTCAAGTYFNAQSMACESCLVGTAAEGSAVRTSCGKCKVCAVKNCLGRARKALETQCAVRHNLLNFLPSLSPPSTHFSTRPHALPVPVRTPTRMRGRRSGFMRTGPECRCVERVISNPSQMSRAPRNVSSAQRIRSACLALSMATLRVRSARFRKTACATRVSTETRLQANAQLAL